MNTEHTQQRRTGRRRPIHSKIQGIIEKNVPGGLEGFVLKTVEDINLIEDPVKRAEARKDLMSLMISKVPALKRI